MAFTKFRNIVCCDQTLRHYCIFNHKHIPVYNLEHLDSETSSCHFPLGSIMTWNVQELFWYQSPGKLDNVVEYLRNAPCDLICLQEVFEHNSLDRIIYDARIRRKYPFFLTGDMRNKYLIGESSGLLVLSSYPLTLVKFAPLVGCEFPDSFASKGVLYFSVGSRNFATTHLQSENQRIAGYQLQYILLESPFGRDFTLLGDLNHETADKVVNVARNNSLITHESNRILDYILPLSGAKFRIKRDTINLHNTTDHYPLIGEYEATEAPPLRVTQRENECGVGRNAASAEDGDIHCRTPSQEISA